jgi:hypothetical protein
MKAILEFDLNDPQEQESHLRCVQSTNLALSLWSIIHKKKKYLLRSEFEKEETKEELIESMYEDFWDTLNEYGINLDRLIS